MKCDRCEVEMYSAKIVGGMPRDEILLINKKKGIFESEKWSRISCYVCPECGHIELIANDPKGLQIG